MVKGHPTHPTNHACLILPLPARPLFQLRDINLGAAAFLPSNTTPSLPTSQANDGTPQTSKSKHLFRLGGVKSENIAFLPSNEMPHLLTT